jgi:hypothetical protein
MNSLKLLLFIVLIASASRVVAQQADDQAAADSAPQPSYPCEDDERFSAFDFWVGEWDVHDASGTYQGSNSIAREERGCVLVENWTGAGGSTGMSINYLDTKSDEWVQFWIAAGGYYIDYRGGMTDDGMSLKGIIHTFSSGKTSPFRGLWTALPDGRVRQFFEISSDDGETWVTWFEGFYTRQAAD